MALPYAFRFVDGSSSSYVQCGPSTDTQQLTDETRVVWCRFDTAPSGNRPFVQQSGGGANTNWLANGSGNVNGFRNFSTTNAQSSATRADVNITIGQPWFGALTMTAGLIRLYGGTLTIPAAEASSYLVSTAGVGTPTAMVTTNVHIGGITGFGQGFPGVIWMAAWFDWAMSLAELRDVQMHPDRWQRRAPHFWELGRDGLGVIDRGRNGNVAPGISITGATMAADNLPLIVTPDKTTVAKYKRAIFPPASGGFFARHYYDSLLVKGHV